MALPTTGPLSINDIRVELGASATNQSLGTFSDTAGFAAPDAISDFYGYSNVTTRNYYYNPNFTPYIKPAQVCGVSTNDLGSIEKGSGNTSLSPEVGDTFKDSSGTIISTGTRYLATNASSAQFFPNLAVQTNGFGVITSVTACT